jgi:hypothetical protein
MALYKLKVFCSGMKFKMAAMAGLSLTLDPMGKMFQNASSLKWSNVMSCGDGHLGFPIGIKNRKFVEDLPMIIPGQFGFNCPSGLLKPNCTRMFIGWSSTKFWFFVPI